MKVRVKQEQTGYVTDVHCELCGERLARKAHWESSPSYSLAWKKAEESGMWAKRHDYSEMTLFACMRCVRSIVWAYLERETKEPE